MERFELLPHLTFDKERLQLAFIGNVPPIPYTRLCREFREGESLSPLVGITAVLGSSAIVDRFRQRYLVADDDVKDEQAPKVAFGMAATILKHICFDVELEEWITFGGDENTTIFEPYYSAHVVKGRNLTTEQLAKLGAKHISMEQSYLEETRKQWAKHLPRHPELLESVTSIAEQYITLVKERTKPTDPPALLQESVEAEHQPVEAEQNGDNEEQPTGTPAMADLVTFFLAGQGGKANEMLAEIGGKSGKKAVEIVWRYRSFIRDENEILNKIFKPLSKLLGWTDNMNKNWNTQIRNLLEKEKKRNAIEKMFLEYQMCQRP